MSLKHSRLAAFFSITAGASAPANSVYPKSTPVVSGAHVSTPHVVTLPSGLDCQHRRDTDPDMSTTERVTFAGKRITLTVPNTPQRYPQVEVRQKAMAAIGNINQNIYKITPADIKIIQNINNIVLSDLISRSGVEEKSGVFFLKIDEVMRQSVGYLSSSIAHDAYHIEQYKRGGYTASRSTQAEVEAIDFQIRLMPALAIEAKGERFLRSYQKNSTAIETRRQAGKCGV